jgi:prevent-host-death family protein
VTVRDLRNKGGEVLDRVTRGESVVITRDGLPVAQLSPLPGPTTAASELIRRRRSLPLVDPTTLRADLDTVLDARL